MNPKLPISLNLDFNMSRGPRTIRHRRRATNMKKRDPNKEKESNLTETDTLQGEENFKKNKKTKNPASNMFGEVRENITSMKEQYAIFKRNIQKTKKNS